ncbi:phage tail protein [Pseudoalteromonas sp. SG44-8]|uniref:phage tail protein n=1 Tax=Pseudoalteromonas sp. SG44-8 TaxID=2760958 RepID=UPI001603C77A|nr:tail fiber protein [Pseudoalteromonas sp. SG44-8]MBB1396730.1 tail fiber protein [Pseudoalteromonas sp. SG44-8]
MSTESFLGSMVPFAGTFTIRDFTPCQGQLLSIGQYTALYSLLGTNFGGDGRTSFGVPDLRGRSPIGHGNRPGGLSYSIGQMAGNEKASLSADNLAQHSHAATFTPTGGGSVGGNFQVATNGANNTTPDADSYLAVAASSIYFKPSGFAPATLTDIKGLTIDGGTSSGGAVTVENTGGGVPFSILNPVVTINWLMSTAGIYPSRS